MRHVAYTLANPTRPISAAVHSVQVENISSVIVWHYSTLCTMLPIDKLYVQRQRSLSAYI